MKFYVSLSNDRQFICHADDPTDAAVKMFRRLGEARTFWLVHEGADRPDCLIHFVHATALLRRLTNLEQVRFLTRLSRTDLEELNGFDH